MTKKSSQCDCCGIMIGEDYLETRAISIGEYHICSMCSQELKKRGKIRLLETGLRKGVLYLLPDGSVMKEKRKVKKWAT